MKTKAIISLFLCLLLLWGCGSATVGSDPTEGSKPPIGTLFPSQSGIADVDTLFTDRDLSGTYDKEKAVRIHFEEGAVSAGNGVTVTGTSAAITKEGTYIVTGSCSDGVLAVYVPKDAKVQLVLEGVTLCSKTGAAIHVIQADKVFVTLAPGSQNVLSNGGSFENDGESNVDAVIFSKEDLTINGSGSLRVTSPAGHGIVSKDELTMAGGSIAVTSASHGVSGKDNVCITATQLQIASGKDGIHGDNPEDAALGFVYIKDGNITIDAQGDGISASSILQIDGGVFDITTGGGSENGKDHTSDGWGGMPGGNMPGGRPGGRAASQTDTEDSSSIKGLKATAALLVNGGVFTMDCADDAIHSNGNITVTAGTLTIESGDDGFHADETLHISGGTIVIAEGYEGLEGLDILVSGGDISITSSDDGINAAGGTDESGFGGNRGDGFGGGFGGMMGGGASNGSITISAGKVFIFAGGDGIDANGSLLISGGEVVIHGPTTGDTSVLDFDSSGIITGGTFIGTGGKMMAQTFTSSENQGVISVSVGSNVAAGTQILLRDSSGNVVLDITPNQNFAIVILSCPEIVKGETYTITVGTASGEFEAK